MTIIPIVNDAFGTVTKELQKGLANMERQHYWERSE